MKRSRWIAPVVLATAVAGCGQKAPLQTPPQPPATLSPAQGHAMTLRVLADEALNELQAEHERILSQLGLTDAQRVELRAIKAKYKAQISDTAFKAALGHFRTALSGTEMDEPAAQAAVSDMEAYFRSIMPQVASMMGEVRDVLTPLQRAQLINRLNETPDPVQPILDRAMDNAFARMSDNLNLTPDQSRTWDELKTRDKEAHAAMKKIVRQAMLRFIMDGNQQSLSTSLESAVNNPVTSDALSWLATLDQAQRQQFVVNMDSYLADLRASLQHNA